MTTQGEHASRLARYRRTMRRRVSAQERATAEAVGGRVQPGSGSVQNPFCKEDALGVHVLVQCKLTDKGSYTLKKKEFLTTEDHALRQCKMPVWRINISGVDLAVCRWKDYEQLLQDGMGKEQ